MSAQYRTEYAKLIAKYAKTFGIHESLIVCRNARGEDSIHVPSRPDLPSWGMGASEQAWSDGPTQDLPRWANWNIQASDAFFRIWGMTRVEFDKRDHRKEWEEFAKREDIKPDPCNYRGEDWSEVG